MSDRALIGLAALASASPATPQRPPATPSIVQGDLLLLPQMHLHDPWIVADQASRTYYLFTRNEAAMTGDDRLGTMVYTSRDLRHWTRPRVVFTLPKGVWANDGSWAPEVHRWRGKWYLFTSFANKDLKLPPNGKRPNYRRSTVLAVSDRLEGPFRLVRDGEPVAPEDRMTLDGSLYVDKRGRPWMVYAHEWLQMTVGTMEAVPLRDDLSACAADRRGRRGRRLRGQC